MKRWLLGLSMVLALSLIVSATDGPLTNASNLGVRTDENGYLRMSSGAGVTDGPLAVFGNIMVRTDENGYLRVSCADCPGTIGGAAIATRVAFGSGADTLTHDAGFTYVAATDTATIGTVTAVTAVTAPSISGGVFITTTTSPAVANIGANSCGTDAATIVGTDNAFAITVGATSGSACRVTFDTTAPNKWACSFSDQTTAVLARQTAATTTTADVTGVFVAGDVLIGVCLAR